MYARDFMCTYYIIETDKKIVTNIKKVFDEYESFKYLGNAATIESCEDIFYKEPPQLLFVNLDNLENPFIKLNEIKQYLEKFPELIALSITKDLAYDAIKYGFFDYLLKPTSEREIRKAALRFKKNYDLDQTKKTLCLKSHKDYKYLDTDEIVFLKADNNSTDFHLTNGTRVVAYKTLKTFENLLPDNFVRIHRSFIINMNFIKGVSYSKNQCAVKSVPNPIPFSRSYSPNIDKLVRSLSQSSVSSLN